MTAVVCRAQARHWLALTVLAVAGLAQAAQSGAPRTTGPTRATSVKFIDAPSGESPAAREKRLRRECRGRPNAGACLGFTR